jgi:hypothetical protein
MKKIILPALMLAVLSSGALNAQTKTDQKTQPAPAKPAAGKNVLPPPMKAPAAAVHTTMPLPKPGGATQVKPATMPIPAAKPATAVKPAAPAKPVQVAPAKPAPVAKPAVTTKPAPTMPMTVKPAVKLAAKPAAKPAAPKKKPAIAKKPATHKKKHAAKPEIVTTPPPPPAPVVTEPSRPVEIEVNKYVESPESGKAHNEERESTYAHHGHNHGEDFDYHTRRAWRQYYRAKRREIKWHYHNNCGSCCDKY